VGQEDRHPWPAGRGPAFGDLAPELALRLRQAPAAKKLGADLEADVVTASGVLAARVAEADDEDSLAGIPARAAEERQGA